jgi:putative membrane protein
MNDQRGGGFGGPGGFGPMQDFGRHGGGHPLGWVLMFLLIALLVILAVWIVHRFTRARPGAPVLATATGPRADDALTTVRMRYARGEIDRDAFLRINADLGGPPEPGGEAPTLA